MPSIMGLRTREENTARGAIVTSNTSLEHTIATVLLVIPAKMPKILACNNEEEHSRGAS